MTHEKNDSNLERIVKDHSLERVKAFLAAEPNDNEKKRMLQLAQLFAVEHGKNIILQGLHDLGATVDLKGDTILFALASLGLNSHEEKSQTPSHSPYRLLATHVKKIQHQMVLLSLFNAIGIQDDNAMVKVSKELSSILTKSKIRNREELFFKWEEKKIDKKIHDLLLSYKKKYEDDQKPPLQP